MDVPNLTERLGGRELSPDDAFELFLDWTLDCDIELYPAQEEAVLELAAGNHVVLCTPTGSGKSLVAVAMHLFALNAGERSFYTSPIKALVSEKFFALCRDFGAENVGMLTGDASINHDAPIICCTAEVLSNMALRQGGDAPADQVVMDEFHYYADRDRGMAWQIPLLAMPHARFLLMSATLGDTSEIETRLAERTGRDVALVSSNQRPVPLQFSYRTSPIHETIEDLVKKGRAPIYIVNFSQRDSAQQAQHLMSVNLIDKPAKRAIADELKDFRFDTPYAKDMQRFLRAGVGLHHAGLLPKYRLLVERLAQKGLLRVVSGTDTLGVGVNVPIRTVLLTKLCKYDGEKTRLLSVREFKQISGRAGRKGFDDRGWVCAQAPDHVIENDRATARLAGDAKKLKKLVRKKPPNKGYVRFDKSTFARLVSGEPEALEPVFKIDHGVMISLLQTGDFDEDGEPDGPRAPLPRGGGYRTLVDLIALSHTHSGRKKRLRREAAELFKALRGADIIELLSREDGPGQDALVHTDLQADFSLHHTLSLYLVDAANRLDQRDEHFALDLLTLVEAILENPRPVLLRQVSHIKGQMVAEMKAEGIPYEERMEKLEGVSWPRPKAEWIYETFDRFGESHPWVGTENIKPKSVAREMVERYCSFNDYVREYGLERVEGLLLRYLTQAYKTLLQNVPEYLKYDDVYDVIAYLRSMLSQVDNSLLVEWERMRTGANLPPEVALEVERKVPDVLDDPKAFAARVRAELHRLVRALSRKDYAEAVLGIRRTEANGWSEEGLEEAMAPFYGSYERLLFDQKARYADKTFIQSTGDRTWEVSQVLTDPEGDDMWAIQGVIDLSEGGPTSDDPLIEVLRIGP